MDFRVCIRYGAVVLGLLAMGFAVAQPRAVTEVAPFTGTLQKIYETGVIRIGHRENSPPFAFLNAQRRPIGYSLDLCDVIVEQVGELLHRSPRVEYVPVSPSNRFDLVNSGAVDLECGSTTASAERRTVFDFSPAIFITGTKLLVKRGSGIRSLRDLRGKTVVLTSGTVHADTVPRLAQRQKVDIQFVFAPDHDASFKILAEGKADAFANDDIQLYGAIALRNAASDYRVVGDFLTYADYALMFRRGDAEFAEVINQAFERMAGTGETRAIYRRWFQQRLPDGANLNVPMSAHLEHVFKLQALSSD
ncbi:amino acid ABC transporter substrate-binding protein [Aquincola sp. S2]|uniref:Amino acid ABC transporter substrate-binding protein n=1 Tax=Pseudaquabacterium terrae TaxID=2732868 RepID=A0ABX2ESS2_9BURK|nr:amino acid ABC transporter substrate-binding protein [Aquabacterium terrae]NRF71749.1 amino acid ABC transporter substrate-binding protein [Aquabacterium terrae]